MSDVVMQVRAGKLRALAVTSAQRIPALPDTPTMIEAGVPDFVVNAWFGVFAPAGTPGEIIKKLNQDIESLLQMPDIAERLSMGGSSVIVGGTPAQFGEFIRAEIEKWSKVVNASGAKVD
jgi:tripartite-type tricarboxylate transporter receptor subunit TctC